MPRLKQATNMLHSLSERDFQTTLRAAALYTGWLYFHDNDSRGNMEGMLDTILVHPRRHTLIFAELKTQVGQLTRVSRRPGAPTQQDWFTALSQVTAPPLVEVWRPADLDRIFTLLKGS